MRRVLAQVTGVALIATVALTPAAPAAAVQPPVVFTAVAQPTYQADGIAWSTVAAGNLVVVGGTFAALRPPGADPGPGGLPRANLAVLDAATGVPTSCAPVVTLGGQQESATVRALAVSPDRATLYLGGLFDAVDGVTRRSLAALDLATCMVVSTFAPQANATVRTIDPAAGPVYVGGDFTLVDGAARGRAAAVEPVGAASRVGCCPGRPTWTTWSGRSPSAPAAAPWSSAAGSTWSAGSTRMPWPSWTRPAGPWSARTRSASSPRSPWSRT